MLPTNANEAAFATQCVAAGARAAGVMRSIRPYAGDDLTILMRRHARRVRQDPMHLYRPSSAHHHPVRPAHAGVDRGGENPMQRERASCRGPASSYAGTPGRAGAAGGTARKWNHRCTPMLRGRHGCSWRISKQAPLASRAGTVAPVPSVSIGVHRWFQTLAFPARRTKLPERLVITTSKNPMHLNAPATPARPVAAPASDPRQDPMHQFTRLSRLRRPSGPEADSIDVPPEPHAPIHAVSSARQQPGQATPHVQRTTARPAPPIVSPGARVRRW
jgi:hypothetical protein